jgi:hypothetical protein
LKADIILPCSVPVGTIEVAKSFTARQIPDVAAYNFRKADFVGLYRELMDVDWSFVSACDDVKVKLYEIFDLHVGTTQEMYDAALSCMV